jgi:hypothetical protein
MCVCTHSGQIQTIIKCAEHLLHISNTKIHINLRFEVFTPVNMKVMVLLQHTMRLISEECAASIFKVASTMKNEATHSCKMLVCIMPKHIKDGPTLH